MLTWRKRADLSTKCSLMKWNASGGGIALLKKLTKLTVVLNWFRSFGFCISSYFTTFEMACTNIYAVLWSCIFSSLTGKGGWIWWWWWRSRGGWRWGWGGGWQVKNTLWSYYFFFLGLYGFYYLQVVQLLKHWRSFVVLSLFNILLGWTCLIDS